MLSTRNRGTGAGGANCTKNGAKFEKITSIEHYLKCNNFKQHRIDKKFKGKYDYYFKKIIDEDTDIVYLTQTGLKTYFKFIFDIELCRNPDEAFLIRNEDEYILKILEKKNQNVAGSVDVKLCTAKYFIEEYTECIDNENFKVDYAFCLSAYLEKEYKSDKLKYKIMRKIYERDNIKVLFGDSETYFKDLTEWIED